MRNCKGQMSKSEIMTILLCYHFGSFLNFKHYYLFFIEEHLASYFLYAVSYTCFVDSTMIPVCHSMRRKFNKVFDGLAKNGKGTMGRCSWFQAASAATKSTEVTLVLFWLFYRVLLAQR